MTRIVAGAARGRRLHVPAQGTRPTSERTREALFNTLRSQLDIAGAHVLDLYSGSGAVGLEALSRGAGRVDLVESDRAAGDVIARNIDAVGLPGARLHRRQARVFLAAPATTAADLVFADPPYGLPDDEVADVLEALGTHLAEGAVVVVERAARSDEPRWPQAVELVTQRRYGDARLWYGRAQ